MLDSKITRYGLWVSGLYLFVMAIYAACVWDHLLMMTPSEFGDFLAGSFGPLALAWLVCGYFQQGIELRQNTEALRLQVDELSRSVAEQSRLAELSQKQLEFEVSKHEAAQAERAALYSPHFKVVTCKWNNKKPIQADNFLVEIVIGNFGAEVVVEKMTMNGSHDSFRKISAWPRTQQVSFAAWPISRGRADQVIIECRYRTTDGVGGLLRVVAAYDIDLDYFADPMMEVAHTA